MNRRVLLALLVPLFAAGCGSGGDTAITKEESARFGGSKPPPEMLKKLQGATPTGKTGG